MTPEERAAHVARVLADWPPLTDEQRARLATLLRPRRIAVAPTPARKQAA